MYSIYLFLYQVCISRYLRTEPIAMPLWPPPKSDMGVGFENNKINILIDNSLKRFNSLFAAAGHPNCVFKTNFSNLQKITYGSIKEIIE